MKGIVDFEPIFSISLGEHTFQKRKEAGEILAGLASGLNIDEKRVVGAFYGFRVSVEKRYFLGNVQVYLQISANGTYEAEMSNDSVGNMVRLENLINSLDRKKEEIEKRLSEIQENLKNSRIEVDREFSRENELQTKIKRQTELNMLLSKDGQEQFTMEETVQASLQNQGQRRGR